MNISIIIPTYNSEKTISRCLNAVAKQSLKPYEVIVVDDCSSDSTLSVLKQFDIKLISLAKNSGPAVARNIGAKASIGDIILFLDSDVIMPSSTLSKIANDFSRFKCDAVQAVYSPSIVYPNLPTDYQQILYTFQFLQMPAEKTAVFATYCAAVKRDVFFNLGMFNTKIKNASAEDAEFGHMLFLNNHKIYLDKSLMVNHNVMYTYARFFKRRCYITKDLIKSYLRIKKHLNKKKGSTSSMHHTTLETIASIPLPLLMLMAMLTYPITQYSLIAVLALASLYILLQMKFFIYSVRKRGTYKALKFILFSIPDNFVISATLAIGMFSYYILRDKF